MSPVNGTKLNGVHLPAPQPEVREAIIRADCIELRGGPWTPLQVRTAAVLAQLMQNDIEDELDPGDGEAF